MKLELTRNSKGFTLIELLIVIVIIGVLTSLLVVNFVGVRVRARDAQRKSDLRQIQSALELYRADQGSYPTSPITLSPPENCAAPAPSTLTYFGNPSCAATYMQKVPKDPSTSPYNAGNYYYSSAGTTYTLAACLENANDGDPNSTGTAPTPAGLGTCTTKYYVLTNP